jgi:hypothetical protein
MLYSTTPEDAESYLRYSHHPVECHEDGEVEVAPVSVASTVSRWLRSFYHRADGMFLTNLGG